MKASPVIQQGREIRMFSVFENLIVRNILALLKKPMVLFMGISFQARHYFLGDSATAHRFYRSWWSLQIKVVLIRVVLCAFSGAA